MLKSNAQRCDLTLKGRVLESTTGESLPFTNVVVEELQKGLITDATGHFELKNLCRGKYHIRLSHIACEEQSQFIEVESDKEMEFYLHHHTELLDEIVVHDEREHNSLERSKSLLHSEIAERGNENLADLIAGISGVNTLKNGSGISKPIVHGMYGNRIAMINNGIVQSGQQWGIDHAPEIDAYVADHISVVKGVGALAYNTNSLGGLVLIEPSEVSSDPHLHGELNYIFQHNGMGHSFNSSIEKGGSWASWRVTGTFKRSGDQQTPDYYLTNTGKMENNYSFLSHKTFGNWKAQIYYSIFNSRIGILRGSHIGNLTDLESAIGRETPFFTEEKFSYQINAPSQRVLHHLLKASLNYKFADSHELEITYGGQIDNRREFDVRRGDRSSVPALKLNQVSHSVNLRHYFQANEELRFRSGVLVRNVNNTNDPETGILPLIPNYTGNSTSVYGMHMRDINLWKLEWGAKFGINYLDVATISREVPRTIENINHTFLNWATSGSIHFQPQSGLKSTLTAGFAERSPEINELYSFGLHQGVSGIEEGNRFLNSEKSIKFIFSNDIILNHHLFIESSVYWNRITDYIYLEPQSDFRLTIRGAFPVFIYEQTNASIVGTDWLIKYEPNDRFKLILQYSWLRGMDTSQDLPLIFMPPTQLSGRIRYSFEEGELFKNTFMEISGEYVSDQQHYQPANEYLAPPEGYFLTNLAMGTRLMNIGNGMKASLKINNVFNQKYRNYLNRLRYYADDIGINVQLGLNYNF